MEEKKENLPKEEKKENLADKKKAEAPVEESIDLAINEKPKDGLDENSDVLTSILGKLTLNDQQKEEVKVLLNNELKTAVEVIKTEVKTEGQELKKDFLTIFGLFASFVTFLSIEVQVFKNKDNVLELIGITSISLSFVMFFALIINDIAKDKSEWKDFCKPTYVINIFFAVLGMIFLYIGGTSSINKMDAIKKQTVSDSTQINLLKTELYNIRAKLNKQDSLTIELKEKEMPISIAQPQREGKVENKNSSIRK